MKPAQPPVWRPGKGPLTSHQTPPDGRSRRNCRGSCPCCRAARCRRAASRGVRGARGSRLVRNATGAAVGCGPCARSGRNRFAPGSETRGGTCTGLQVLRARDARERSLLGRPSAGHHQWPHSAPRRVTRPRPGHCLPRNRSGKEADPDARCRRLAHGAKVLTAAVAGSGGERVADASQQGGIRGDAEHAVHHELHADAEQ
jgi:hypothetical protein